MLRDILEEAWAALQRNRTRSFLTMLGITWGVVAVSLLLSYGQGFRSVIVAGFNAFGRDVVVAWPGTTSRQVGGPRAGKRVRFSMRDVRRVRVLGTFVKHVSPETVHNLRISYENQMTTTAIRGVYPVYGPMRSEVPGAGRWISPDDLEFHRHVVFLGALLRRKLFGRLPAVGRTVQIAGIPFQVIGTMHRKIQLSNYFTSDDESAWIPYTAASDLWNTRYASVLVFEPVAPEFEKQADHQVLRIVAARQHFSPADKQAIFFVGRLLFQPIIEGLTVGIQVLLAFVGTMTLGIGGVGLMNIMLVSVGERVREIGLRRALGARRWQIRVQVLAETLVLTVIAGLAGLFLSVGLGLAIGRVPLLGPIFHTHSGKGNVSLNVSITTTIVCIALLGLVGMISGLAPAERAARLDPSEALRYE